MLFGSRELVRLLGNFEEYAAWILEEKSETLRLGSKGLWRVLASFWNRSKLTRRG